MANFTILKACSFRLDEIYRYGYMQWGEAQAKSYIKGIFEKFNKIATQEAFSYPIPAEFEVQGFYTRYQHHFIYWRHLKNSKVGIVTVLHKRMHQGIHLLADSLHP